MGAQVRCVRCEREHYASFKECPFCEGAETSSGPAKNKVPPEYDNDEARAAYARIGTQKTWDGRRETAESPSFEDPKS